MKLKEQVAENRRLLFELSGLVAEWTKNHSHMPMLDLIDGVLDNQITLAEKVTELETLNALEADRG